MTKRASKENAKDRKSSEDMGDDSKPPPHKRKRDETILWIKDDTLPSDSAESAEIKNDSQPDEEEDEYEPDESDFIEYLMDKYVTKNGKESNKNKYNTRSQSKKFSEKIPIELTKKEKDYYMRQPVNRRKELLNLMEKM
jgi:hypothetical protein